jgi:hypothetical protein
LLANVEKGFVLFGYEKENIHREDQVFLLRLLERKTRNVKGEKRKLLDFGIGGNYSHLIELNGEYPNVEFEGCDIYQNAVMEHLDDTIPSWQYLNSLLKSMKDGGGIMIHAFPSQITEDYLHWAIRIRSHECLFSKKSLSILCSKTGFDFIKIVSSPFAQHPLYFFEKTKDV